MKEIKSSIEFIIEGGCRGADQMAKDVAETLGITIVEFPANWSEGRAGGPLRNIRMIAYGKPTHVVAFHDSISTSSGTASMLMLAKRYDIPYCIVTSKRQDIPPAFWRSTGVKHIKRRPSPDDSNCYR